MIAEVRTSSPLRLPVGGAATAASLPADGLRARLEELARRAFSGRVSLQADDWQAEMLLRDGQVLAVAFGGPGLDEPLQNRAALVTLLDQAGVAWSCHLEPIEGDALDALAGVGGKPETSHLTASEHLRVLLRDLAQHAQDGVLELSTDRHWGRTLVAGSRVLGAYSDARPELAASLAPLGDLLSGPSSIVNWYPAGAATGFPLPQERAVEGAAVVEVARWVTWIVSRFEGAWGRVRERGDAPERLQEALVQMLQPLLTLADQLETARGDTEALEAALSRFSAAGDDVPAEPFSDPRLAGLGARQACSTMVGLVADALRRVVTACPDPGLAEYCRQAALALEGELRLAFPPDVVAAEQDEVPAG